jgi:hypothetical protein
MQIRFVNDFKEANVINRAHEVARFERTPGLLGSVHDLARYMGVTPRRVQQLAKEGIIEKAGRGGYDIIRCLAMYVAYLGEWRSSAEIPCSRDDLAHFLGLRKEQILYLTGAGIIPATARGRYDLATGIQAYLGFIRQQYVEGTVGRGKKAPWRCPEVKGLKLL